MYLGLFPVCCCGRHFGCLDLRRLKLRASVFVHGWDKWASPPLGPRLLVQLRVEISRFKMWWRRSHEQVQQIAGNCQSGKSFGNILVFNILSCGRYVGHVTCTFLLLSAVWDCENCLGKAGTTDLSGFLLWLEVSVSLHECAWVGVRSESEKRGKLSEETRFVFGVWISYCPFLLFTQWTAGRWIYGSSARCGRKRFDPRPERRLCGWGQTQSHGSEICVQTVYLSSNNLSSQLC